MQQENKKTMKPTFEEVIRMDENLRYLATYEVTGGKMIVPLHPEDMFDITKDIAEKFNYFKKLIQDGECTYEFIKTTVLSKNGPYIQNKKPLDFSDPKCFLEDDALEIIGTPKENLQNLIEKMVSSVFPGATLEKIEYTNELPENEKPTNQPTDAPFKKKPTPKSKKKNKKQK